MLIDEILLLLLNVQVMMMMRMIAGLADMRQLRLVGRLTNRFFLAVVETIGLTARLWIGERWREELTTAAG